MTKRALMLAGGGVKVAFQAGVLQVWLDEAGLQFDLADGASGGTLNLAMYVQGMSGTQIADNWRNIEPVAGVDLNWEQYVKLFWAASLFDLDNYRKKVFPSWGIDFDKIRASNVEATFNVYNFSKQELAVFEPKDMTEDLLCAGVSLPMWFPPVKIGGETYIDSVFSTDCNLEEAIRRGADELWVIWTVSFRGEWFDGFIGNYFGMIEAAADGRYKDVLKRIEANNANIAAGKAAEFGRTITVKELRAEVPLHYLINFSQDRSAEAVNRGVVAAREWCATNGIPLTKQSPVDPQVSSAAVTKLQFTEELRGFADAGSTNYEAAYVQGKANGNRVDAKLTIKVGNVDQFIRIPDHEAAIEGWVTSELGGEKRPVESGVFNLLVDKGDPSKKKMLYRLHFSDQNGQPLTMSGFKDVSDDSGGDVWADTTTLFIHIYDGHLASADEAGAAPRATGIIRLTFPEFLRQLTTFRTEGATLADRTSALARFGALFLGSLWDVYARRVLPYGPF